MKMHEAIRLGAMMKPQAFGDYYRFNDQDGSVVGTCALGAAADAMGMEPDSDAYTEWEFKQQAAYGSAVCPACTDTYNYPRPCDSMVIHLNDTHMWTRERIADWLEGLDREREAAHNPEIITVDAS